MWLSLSDHRPMTGDSVVRPPSSVVSWLSESKRFAPNGARIRFSSVAAYKHLAPNGAKTITCSKTDEKVR